MNALEIGPLFPIQIPVAALMAMAEAIASATRRLFNNPTGGPKGHRPAPAPPMVGLFARRAGR